MADKSDTLTKCLLVVVVVVVALLAIVAIIIAAVSLGGNKNPTVKVNRPDGSTAGSTGSSKTGDTGGGTGNAGNGATTENDDGTISQEEKTWMIAVGHDWGAQEYIDVDGYIRGFQMDLILEVCELAGMVCRTVWEPYNNCFDSEPGQHSYGGQGLMGRWYDACCGWVQTVGRMEIFDFSMPFLKDLESYFFVKEGNSLDLKNAKAIGFLDGWSSDEKCVARMGIDGTPLDASQVKHYNTTDQFIDAIQNGEVEAGFAPYGAFEDSGLVQWEAGFFCSKGGSSMMTRKDNDFNQYWNKGWQAFKNNGGYRKLCDKAKDTHGVGRKLMPCY